VKRVLIIVFCIFISLVVLLLIKRSRIEPKTSAPLPAPSLSQEGTPVHASPVPSKTVSVDGQIYVYALMRTDPSKVTLIANFTDRLDTTSLMRKHACRMGINGGFYDTDTKPLGLFVTEGETVHIDSENALFNGFLSIDQKDKETILPDPPTLTRIALQTGPLLIQKGEPLPLRIKNDEHARRMVGATTTDGQSVFLTVYNPEAVFEGPLLGNLPDAVREISSLESIPIDAAINLDGGSASAFYSDATKLSELTPIGSLFCIKSRVQ
jgi:uncharacterized protein YigE (DUF2233 family)